MKCDILHVYLLLVSVLIAFIITMIASKEKFTILELGGIFSVAFWSFFGFFEFIFWITPPQITRYILHIG